MLQNKVNQWLTWPTAGVNENARTRVIRSMGAFATLASVYNTPVAMHGDVDFTHSNSNAQSRALNQFLAGVEIKAFKIAQSALRHEHDALDAVQDAMLQLARAYADRPAEEWRPLFYRILENRIRDMQRRRTVRARIMAWLPAARDDEDDEASDPIAQAPSDAVMPDRRLEIDESMKALDEALKELPNRQRQAFLLRNLEGMDVAEVASVMGCSEGSVKTHHFRALKALRARLGEFST